MAETNGDKRYISFKMIASILATLVLIAWTAILADTRTNAVDAKFKAEQLHQANLAKIECLQREKLDKEQYYRDLGEIRDTLKSIDRKTERMK